MRSVLAGDVRQTLDQFRRSVDQLSRIFTASRSDWKNNRDWRGIAVDNLSGGRVGLGRHIVESARDSSGRSAKRREGQRSEQSARGRGRTKGARRFRQERLHATLLRALSKRSDFAGGIRPRQDELPSSRWGVGYSSTGSREDAAAPDSNPVRRTAQGHYGVGFDRRSGPQWKWTNCLTARRPPGRPRLPRPPGSAILRFRPR